jgi:hypothetical protein
MGGGALLDKLYNIIYLIKSCPPTLYLEGGGFIREREGGALLEKLYNIISLIKPLPPFL